MPFIVAPPVAPAPVVAVSTLGARAFDRLPHYVRAADDGTVAALLAAVGAPVQSLVELLIDPGAHGDPDRVPFARLGWLAAMAGVDVDGVPNAALRSWVGDPDNYYRGDEQTIARRVGLTLTGSKVVRIECPYLGDPEQIRITTITAETPDPDATEAAARREVPAWLVLTYRHLAGMTYSELSAAHTTYADLGATGYTYGQLQELT